MKQPFPDDGQKLTMYHVPSIDIRPAITVEIMIKNSRVLHRLTFFSLTQEEFDSAETKGYWQHSLSHNISGYGNL